MAKVAIIAGTITGNRGGEAMLTTIIGRVLDRDRSATIHVFSYYPKADRQRVNHPNIKIFSATPLYLVTVLFPASLILAAFKWIGFGQLRALFPESVTCLEESDVLVDIAGVAFIDGREKFLPFNILTIWPAMLLGVPVLKFSQAIGPFQSVFNRLAARLFLPRCRKIFARGDVTYQHLRELPLPETMLDQVPDVVFLHQSHDSITQENESYVTELEHTLRMVKSSSNQLLIGICPSAVIASHARKEGWNYPELLARIVKELLIKGYSVFLFPNATRKESQGKLRNNDLPVIEEVVRHLASEPELKKNLYAVTEDINTRAIKTLLRYCDVAIVSRFHAMIAALCLERPLLVMGWGHKYLEVMQTFNLEEYVLDYKMLAVPALIQKVETVIAATTHITEKIHATLPTVKQAAYRQIDYLFELLHV